MPGCARRDGLGEGGKEQGGCVARASLPPRHPPLPQRSKDGPVDEAVTGGVSEGAAAGAAQEGAHAGHLWER